MADVKSFKTDIRSVRTRKAIKYALIQLLKTKDIKDVSVRELTEMSDRNRNSFYTHYHSVYEVLHDINNDVVDYLNVILKKYTFENFLENPYALLNEVGNFIVSHKKAATLYMNSSCTTEIINSTKELLTNQFVQCSKRLFGENNSMARYLIMFVVTGLIDVYRNWLLQETVEMKDLTDVLASFIGESCMQIKRYIVTFDKGKINN